MSQALADQFVEALHTLEDTEDVEPMARLYTPDAEVGNVLAPEKFHGPEGARDFWGKYRSTFENLKSSFRNHIVTTDRVVLEWKTEGTSVEGTPVSYEGVSLLEVEGDRIARFRAYFDAASLGRQIVKP